MIWTKNIFYFFAQKISYDFHKIMTFNKGYIQIFIPNWLIMIVLVIILFGGPLTAVAYPKIIAHRGGKNNFPENTFYAFENSLKSGADAIELDVQLTKDDVVVLYHPNDLSVWTKKQGPVSEFNYSELEKLDAAYNYDPRGDKTFPFRGQGHTIPTLSATLDKFPDREIIIDLKSLPAPKLIDAIIATIDQKNNPKIWRRLIFYSTNDEHLIYLWQKKPDAHLFESRDQTRKRLLTLRNSKICCCSNNAISYVGFELERPMIVEESFTLGKSSNEINFKLWDDKAIKCTQKNNSRQVKIFLFGVNSKQAYQEAEALGAYAVFTDAPVILAKYRNEHDEINPEIRYDKIKKSY